MQYYAAVDKGARVSIAVAETETDASKFCSWDSADDRFERVGLGAGVY